MIRTVFSGVFAIIVSYSLAFAQSNTVTFPSSELQQMALRYSGNTLNWPVIVQLADHDISSNTFSLSPADILQLQNLSEVSTKVSQSENRVRELISSGATIFAKEKLNSVNTLHKEYIDAIQAGELESALEKGIAIPNAVNELESTLNENRLVQVQAQLAEKEGNVDKRLGLLGSWSDAVIGDLFKESDGLRTLAESYASLAFTDGSSVLVDPNTIAVIRKSRIDKLDESSDTEISLVQGGLLAKLSAAGKERSRYILNAGASTSELRTQNFYAESDGNETVKLTNYDGVADISANDVTITIKKNEGTIVREGEPPAPPIQLLPAPKLVWANNDTIVYRDNIVFSFNSVPNAASYRVQYSTSSSFDKDIKEVVLRSTSVNIPELALGRTYIRVQAVDNLGLRGPYTEASRVIRNVDNQPPAIFIDDFENNIIFTLDNSYLLQGVTEPDARLEIDNRKIPIQLSGQFIYQVQNLRSDQTLIAKATDGSGNAHEQPIRIVKLTESELFSFSLSGATLGDIIRVNRPTVTLSATAYPGLEVIINNEGNIRRVQTDSQGRWGITMNMQEGELSVTFRGVRSGEDYLTKSFTVQAN